MATLPRGTANSEFVADNLEADKLRDELLKAHVDAASQPTMESALALFSFMSALPDAFAASQQREAKRLQKSGRDKDPRIEALKASIAETDRLRTTARWGQARVDRTLASLSDQNDVFHGFVSDTDLRFLKGYTVKLVSAGDTGGKTELSATTENDGYFCMTLVERKAGSQFSAKNEAQANMSAMMSVIFGVGAQGAPEKAEAAANSLNATAAARSMTSTAPKASVEIFDPSGQRVHQDPFPVEIDGGSVYREYVFNSKDSSSGTQRYAGNPSTREIHDTQKLTKRCNFGEIDPKVLVYFDDTAAAERAGYDYCAYCFGKAKSKR